LQISRKICGVAARCLRSTSLELDVVFWYLFSVIFHLDDFDNFVLRTASRESVWAARKTSVFKPVHRWFACFRRSRMGRKAEGFAAFIGAFLLYTRQCIVLLYALDTNVLPMARDVCTLWRWETDRAKTVHFNLVATAYHFVALGTISVREKLLEVGYACDEDKFDRMRTDDMLRVIAAYPNICTFGAIILVTIFIAPQLIYLGVERQEEALLRCLHVCREPAAMVFQ